MRVNGGPFSCHIVLRSGYLFGVHDACLWWFQECGGETGEHAEDPQSKDDRDSVIIQCDKRIAKVDLRDGGTVLSDGRGGHQGFHKLNSFLGASSVVCPDEILAELRQLCGWKVPVEVA